MTKTVTDKKPNVDCESYNKRHQFDHVWRDEKTGKSYDPDKYYDPVFDDPKNQ